MFIPEGFAHGFQTLTDDVEMLYFHTANYAPTSAAGVNPIDPKLAIVWPLPFTEVSVQDKNLPMLLPGVNIKTGPDDFYPIEREQLARFDGKTWVLFGKVYGR